MWRRCVDGENPVSVSSAPIAKLGAYRYYDLPGNLEVMGKVMRESVVDGFELQFLPEWDGENLPLTDAQYADWGETPKYAPEDVLTMLEGVGCQFCPSTPTGTSVATSAPREDEAWRKGGA